MIIPYDTDAPIYHFPWMTISIIAINVFVFAGEVIYPEEFSPYMLFLGEGLHPVQWLTCNFLHADIIHLLGNMVFLWSFGIIVEGKLGWWKFLLAYCTIGVTEGLFVQVIMQGSEPGAALGASGVIFGLLAMNFLWAPKNELTCLYWFWPFVGTAEFSIQFFSIIFIGWECVLLYLQGFEMSSAFLHVAGATVGLGLAYFMLVYQMVDCEGWDWISLADKELALQNRSPRAKAAKKSADSKFKIKKVKTKSTKKKSSPLLQNSNKVLSEKKQVKNEDTWTLKKK
jgi:membrane associated rhomboid family serine protease